MAKGRPYEGKTNFVSTYLSNDEKKMVDELIIREKKRTGYNITLSDILRKALELFARAE